MKDEKDRKRLSFLESEAYDYFFFVTNKTELLPEEVVEFYEKRGNCENYIFHGSTRYFDLSQTGKIIYNVRICEMDRKK